MSVSTFVACLFIALALLLTAIAATYSARYGDAMDDLDELKAELDESRGREQELQNHVDALLARLGDTPQPQGFEHVNLAAPTLDLNTPFLDGHFATGAPSADELARWFDAPSYQPPTSED